jgi:hypothetical protein
MGQADRGETPQPEPEPLDVAEREDELAVSAGVGNES